MTIVYSLTFPFHRLQSGHLDCILVTGNNLHVKIASTHDFLLPSDIPEHFSEFRADLMIHTEKELFGTLHNNINICGIWLDRCFVFNAHTGFKDSWKCMSWSCSIFFYMCNICSAKSLLHICPHSRDKIGMSMDPGTSVLLYFTDIETCCLYSTDIGERKTPISMI